MDQNPSPETAPDAPPEAAANARLNRALEIAVAAAFILVGLVILRQVWVRLPLFDFGQVGPGLLPAIVAVVLIALGAAVIVAQLSETGVHRVRVMPTGPGAARVLTIIAMFVVTIVVTPYLGMLTTLGLFVLVETWLIERRPFGVCIAAALMFPLFVYLTFDALLGVGLPAGVLGFM